MTKKTITIFFVIIFSVFLFGLAQNAEAQSLGSKLSGRILINTEKNGEAWYVNPADQKRHYLGRPADAFAVMRKLGVGVTESDFQKIAQAGMPVSGDLQLAKQLSGKIMLQVERNGEAWYVNPVDLKKYYLGRPQDAFNVMRSLGLGINIENISKIQKYGTVYSIDSYSEYAYRKIQTDNGTFGVDIITIDLANPNLKIITDTADNYNCKTGCAAKPLLSYIKDKRAFAAINGSYFDTSVQKKNYYFSPVFNSNTKNLINEDQLKWWTTGPVMAFDQNNKFYYFKDSRDFKSKENFENVYGVKLQALISNKPRLIEKNMNVLIDWEVDKKQLTAKTTRNAIAYKNNKLYLVVAYKSTVPDLGKIMESMGVEYAINLDGGYSTAMFYDDEMLSGPGRDIPNAILFSNK